MGTVISFVAMADMPNRIFELRKARGLSQQALGDLVGCSKVHISGIERGTREFSLGLMRRIARVFSVAPADLLSEDDNPDRLTEDEGRLIENYRSADDRQREMVQRLAEPAAEFQAAGRRQDAA
jgi:transcriptional regulator with XRE-family HTH domain